MFEKFKIWLSKCTSRVIVITEREEWIATFKERWVKTGDKKMYQPPFYLHLATLKCGDFCDEKDVPLANYEALVDKHNGEVE